MAKPMTDYVSVNSPGNDYPIRYESLNDRPHLVVPVVMMTEGVHNGIYHSIEELGKYAHTWNGIPVTVNHPRVNGTHVSANEPTILENYQVGAVFHSYVEDNKLKGEVWLDEERLRTVSPAAFTYILAKKPMDVSLGITSDYETREGEWNGEHYDRVAINDRPDHLALLPNGTGACSWDDGAGIRVNEQSKSEKVHPISFYVVSLSEKVRAVSRLVDTLDSETTINFVEDVLENEVIYRQHTMSEGRPPEQLYYRRAYTFSNNVAEWNGAPVPVVREVKYRVINANEGGTMPVRKEKISKLIDAGVFEEKDREMLEKLEDGVFNALKVPEPKTVEKVVEVEKKGEVTVNEAIEVLKKDEKVDLMSLFPQETQAMLKESVEMYRAHKEALVAKIKAYEGNKFTEDELKAMNPDQLTKIAAFIRDEEPTPAHFGLFGAEPRKPEVVKDYADDYLPVIGWDDLVVKKEG
jgi:hypothetical protein